MPAGPKERIGMGIIGAGARGVLTFGRWTSDLYRKHSLKITAICDIHPQRLKDAQESVQTQLKGQGGKGKVKAYRDVDALIDDPDVDLVVITTPQDFHEQPFLKAIEASKKLIYCDKPLAHTLDSCDRMYEAYKSSKDIRCMIGFTRRYEPVWVRAKKLVDSDIIGQPQMLLLRSIIPYSSYFGGGWWRRKECSGDLLNEKCAHHFDMLNWFGKSLPNLVQAVGGRNVFTPRTGYPKKCAECDRDCPYRVDSAKLLETSAPDIMPTFPQTYSNDPGDRLARDLCVYSPDVNVIDHAIVNLGYQNGIKALLFVSFFGYHSDDQETLEVVGDKGKLVLSRHAKQIDVVTDYAKGHITEKYEGEKYESGHFGADPILIETISRFCTERMDPPASFEDAYYSSKIAFAAHEAIDSGESQKLTWHG